MARKKVKARFILMIMAVGILLVAFIAGFLRGGNIVKMVLTAAALSILLFLLIYYQLRFYREGDIKQARNHRKFPPAESSIAPGYLKSPHHRAIWESLDQIRCLMRNKESEFLQARMKQEKRAIGLPQEEEIVFMADRSRFYIWPVTLVSLFFLLFAISPSKGFSSVSSFVCLVFGLLGLLMLTAARFPNRYYMTNFRVLIRKKSPLKKEQWLAMNYRGISAFSRIKTLASEQLTLKSNDGTIRMQGLSKHDLDIILSILLRKSSLASHVAGCKLQAASCRSKSDSLEPET
jgi:hypothetical protein